MHVQCHAMIILLQAAFFLIFISSAAVTGDMTDWCDSANYGHPDYSSCLTLLFGNRVRRITGIFNIDSKEHGFLLPYFSPPGSFTINQWRHRVELPRLWENGTWIPRSHSIVSWLSLADVSYIRPMQDRAHSRNYPYGRLHDRHRNMGRYCNSRQTTAG